MKHPYDALLPTSRFQTYTLFLLTCWQINHEVKEMFSKHYSHRIVLYCDSMASLRDTQEHHRRFPVLSAARYMLRAGMVEAAVRQTDEEWRLRRLIHEFISQQPGFQTSWLSKPIFFDTRPDVERRPLRSISATTLHPWVPEEHGFRLWGGDHAHCVSSESCIQYEELLWPQLANGCRLSTCGWQGAIINSKHLESGTREYFSAVVLQGDLTSLARLEGAPVTSSVPWLFNIPTNPSFVCRRSCVPIELRNCNDLA